MSNLIDISIKKAEKFEKFGDLASAKSVIGELLEKYPGNPRAKALAIRIDKKSFKHVVSSLGSDQKTIKELESLTHSNQWINLIQRCLELIEHDERSPVVWNFLGIAQRAKGLPFAHAGFPIPWSVEWWNFSWACAQARVGCSIE